MNTYQSIATINKPEFINLEPLDINPGMAKCEIKVLYLGNNRNKTSISKDAATSMAKTLRGAPIVGYYKEEKGDFVDHGEQITIDGDGVHFKNLTRPYGFVSPDAQVWFQDFQETDEAGREIVRTYLMTTGYLWVEQYEEAKQVFEDGGKPHSMELEKKSLSGFWSKDTNSNYEFFIINDAIFSKLCMLGDDVEPCFEGSSVTAPQVSKLFTLDDLFKKSLYDMMKELQYTLEGGNKTVEDVKNTTVNSSTPIAPEVVEEATTTFSKSEDANPTVEEVTEYAAQDNNEEASAEAAEVSSETDSVDATGGDSDSGSAEYAKKEEEEDAKASEDSETKEDDEEDKKKDDKDAKKAYALLESKFDELQTSFQKLTEANQQLTEELSKYKKIVEEQEDQRKDELIAEFSLLSEEDKKDIIDHKSEYSYDTIKSKLAVMYYDKKISYTNASEDTMTVSIDTTSESAMPDWLRAVEDRRKNEQ